MHLEHDSEQIVIVYYAGHGQRGTGAWVVSQDEILSVADLFELCHCYATSYGKVVVIVSDACYSGHSCQKHKDALEGNDSRTAAQSMLVCAAAKADSLAKETHEGGRFTSRLLSDSAGLARTLQPFGEFFFASQGAVRTSDCSIHPLEVGRMVGRHVKVQASTCR